MTTHTNETVLLEALRIGEELLAKAEVTPGGYAWSTITMGTSNSIAWEKSEGVYNGVSGIVLLFIELYKRTNDKRYYQAAVEGMRWTWNRCEEQPTDYYAFFTGRLGVAYTMVKMHELTGDKSYLEKSISIARQSHQILNSARPIDDLINGVSGALLCLMHIHAATGDEALLPIIDSFIKFLTERASHGTKGLYWDRGPDQVTGLCGFSHGAAGIGFAFLEAGRYFGNDAFYWIAEQAFQYETAHFDAARGNWPDFRKGYYTKETYQEFLDEFAAGNTEYFTRAGDMAAWCHGAPGIGLSRIRAYEILKDPVYKHHLELALEKTEATSTGPNSLYSSFTLCHGGGGNAMLFLEAYRLIKDERLLELSRGVALAAISSKERHGLYMPGLGQAGPVEDTSLFMGNAGIAYFYLMTLDPLKVPSILAPTVNKTFAGNISSKYTWIGISRTSLKEAILRKVFPRTIDLLKQLMAPALDEAMSGSDLKQHFADHAKATVLPLLEGEERQQAEEIFTLELEKLKLQEGVLSNAWLHIKKQVHLDTVRAVHGISNEDLLNRQLTLDPGAKIKTTKWNWSGQEAEEDAEEHSLLLKAEVEGVMEEPIMPFLKAILESFEKKLPVKSGVERVLESFELEDAAEKAAVQEVILQQIQQAVLAGILVEEK